MMTTVEAIGLHLHHARDDAAAIGATIHQIAKLHQEGRDTQARGVLKMYAWSCARRFGLCHDITDGVIDAIVHGTLNCGRAPV